MALFVASAFVGNAGAQTDVTSTYLKNADFSETTPVTGEFLYGYKSDGTPYGFQDVDEWKYTILKFDKEAKSGMAGGVFSYGSNTALKGNNKKSPTTSPEGLNNGNCLGFFGVWGCGGYYYQEVTLVPGEYTITIPVYNASGTQSYTSYIGFIPNEGTSHTMATNPAVGQWTTLTTRFELTESVSGKIALGYQSTGSGSGANPHLFFDCVKIEFTGDLESGAKSAWSAAIQSANAALENEVYAVVTGEERKALEDEIDKAEPTTAEGYVAATDAVNSALNAFTAAETDYNTLIATKKDAKAYTTAAWPYASEAKKTALDNAANATPTNAADAAAKANAIVTAYRQFVESNGIAEGVAIAVDYTNKLKGTDAAVSTEGWNIGTNQGQSYTDGDGKTTAKYFDGGWASNAGVNLNLNQNVTLPSGKYLLQITARGAASLDTYTMSVGASTVDLPKDGGVGGTFGNGWSDRYLVFESEGTELTINITAKSTVAQQWISFNRIRLIQLEVYEELATEKEYRSLNEAIDAAEEKTLGFDDGEYAPYNNIAALQALAKAKSVNQEVQNVKSEIEAVTSELTSVVWTVNVGEVNAIYDGNFAIQEAHETSGGLVLKGWDNTSDGMRQLIKNTEKFPGLNDASGKAAIFTWNGSYSYGKADGYTIPLKANTIYELSFKHAGWNGANANGFNVSVLNASGEGLATTDMGKATNGIDKAGSLVEARIRFKTTAAGNYVLTMAPKANATFTDVELYTAKTVDFEFKVDWGTLILPFAAEKPEGMEVYTCEAENNGTLELVAVDKIEANTPYIVEKTGETTEFTFTGEKISFEEATHTSGMLTGTFESTKAPVGSYVLQKQNEVLGFYKVAEGKQPTIGAYRCYINASESAAPMFSLERGEGTTSIEDAELTNETVVIYDLAGRRVEKMEKGIYIVNGKKVIR